MFFKNDEICRCCRVDKGAGFQTQSEKFVGSNPTACANAEIPSQAYILEKRNWSLKMRVQVPFSVRSLIHNSRFK